MNNNVTGIAHVGCLVKNRDETMLFLEKTLGIVKNKRHFINYSENSKIMGIPNSVMNIGFAKQDDGDIIFEMIEYLSPPTGMMINDSKTIGSSMISFEVSSIDIILKKCEKEKILVPINKTPLTFGIFKGQNHAVIKYDDFIYFELIECKETNRAKIIKISYIVSDFEKHTAFLKKVSFNFHSEYNSFYDDKVKYETKVFTNTAHPFIIELLKNITEATQSIDIHTNCLGLAHICYHTDDIDLLYADLSSCGYAFTAAPVELQAGLNTGAKANYATIPDGLKAEFYEGRLLPML